MNSEPASQRGEKREESTGVIARTIGLYKRGSNFFNEVIWEARLDELPRGRAWAYQTARVVYCTLRSLFIGDRLQVRAAALTYFTVLSLVPLLAFAFALLKGFGAYDVLVEDSIRPYVTKFLSGNQALQTAFDQILGFVDSTGVTSLGFIGLVTLLYAATRLLRNIELALNEIWSVKASRETVQQLRDYVAIIVVTPICMMAGAGLTTAGQAFAGETLGIGELLDKLIGVLGPLVVLFLGFLFLYKIMPYTRVRFVSAVTGAAIGALLWFAVLIVHVRFQVGVANYNALYSSFGAIPIFLAWLQISWLVVLAGAQVAATHQNSTGLAQRRRMAHADQALRESIALAAMLKVGKGFLACEGAVSRAGMSLEFSVPEPLLRELLDHLMKAGIVAESGLPNDPAYVLAKPPESIHVKDMLDAIRRSEGSPRDVFMTHTRVGELAAQLWHELDDALAHAPANRTLRDVLESELVQTPRAEAPQSPVDSGRDLPRGHGGTGAPVPAE